MIRRISSTIECFIREANLLYPDLGADIELYESEGHLKDMPDGRNYDVMLEEDVVAIYLCTDGLSPKQLFTEEAKHIATAIVILLIRKNVLFKEESKLDPGYIPREVRKVLDNILGSMNEKIKETS